MNCKFTGVIALERSVFTNYKWVKCQCKNVQKIKIYKLAGIVNWFIIEVH